MLYLLVALLLPYTIGCISGGDTVESSDIYPFSVTLTNPILCGGSIISLQPPWILTAAHCIENFKLNEEDSSVAYGSRDFSRQSYARIKQVISHPMYISAAQLKSQVFTTDGTDIAPYDIALVELTEFLTASSTVNRVPLLENKNDTSLQILETIGMGYTGVHQPQASILQYATCNSSHTIPLRNNNFNHSVILTSSNANLCHGDSGSPLLYKSSGEYYLAGILNRIANAYDPDPENTSCPLRESSFTDFTNIFVRPSSHMTWITEVTGISPSLLTSPVVITSNNDNNSNIITSSSFSNHASTTLVHSTHCCWILITCFFFFLL